MDRLRRVISSTSPTQTIALGRKIGKSFSAGSVICLSGDLGAGKTTLIKGIVASLTQTKPVEVCSPTFAYLHIYEGKCPVYHFDLYRLQDTAAFLSMGFEEYLFSNEGVCCMEWSERITSILPKHALHIHLAHAENKKRIITYEIPKC